jgi:ferrous iron transport protein B
VADELEGQVETEVVLPERRYEVIGKILEKSARRARVEWTFSDFLDHALLNRVLGIPIFLCLVWALFYIIFEAMPPFQYFIGDMIFGNWWLAGYAGAGIPGSFVAEALCGGVGMALSFIPIIFAMFFGLALMEKSGYMTRAAFLMDRIMYRLGLTGRSFMPMMLGFGCNIPAIMATRSIESENDRKLTILVNPLMSCSARLPIYTVIGFAIWGAGAAAAGVTFSLYFIGVVFAILMALLFRKTLFPGKPAPFLLELPPYRMPTLSSTLSLMWERGRWFIIRAGTIIFIAIIVLWALRVAPWGATAGGTLIENSYLADMGRAFDGMFAPMGWGWMVVVALIVGFIAKEAVVFAALLPLAAIVPMIGGAGSGALFTSFTAFTFMLFTLLYIPCVASIGVIVRELNWKWALFSMVYLTGLAYIVTLIISGFGHLAGAPFP